MGAKLKVQDLTRASVPCEGCSEPVDQSWGKVRFCTSACRRNASHRRRYYATSKAERVARSGYVHAPVCEVPCESCGAPIVKRGEESRRFCLECGTGKGHVARARRYSVLIEPIDRTAVFMRDGWVCQICHRPVDKGLSWPHAESVSLDHILPLSRGGAHVESNVQTAHLGCNTGKGARS